MSTGQSQMQQIFPTIFLNGIHQKTYTLKKQLYPEMIHRAQ